MDLLEHLVQEEIQVFLAQMAHPAVLVLSEVQVQPESMVPADHLAPLVHKEQPAIQELEALLGQSAFQDHLVLLEQMDLQALAA